LAGLEIAVKEFVHPQYVNLQSRGGLGWLEGFNELMVRCGLEFAGHPGKDKFINNVGDEAEMDLTLHGKSEHSPSEVEVIVDNDGPGRFASAGVWIADVLRPEAGMWTEYSPCRVDTFTIHDTIVNRGAHDQEFQLIYHSNFGPSVLQEGAKFFGAVERVAPFNDNALAGAKSWTEYQGPTKGSSSRCYCLFPLANADGAARSSCRIARRHQGVSITFNIRELPY
jgi:hypothetical protein